MHPIRRHILEQLTLSSRLRFAQLKPRELASNHFIYYLKQLIRDDFVRKEGEHYLLSKAGIQYANMASLSEDMSVRLQPKIMTAIVCIKDGQILLQKRLKEPYHGKVTLVNGKLHYGESIHEAARRELAEKTGLIAKLTHVGDVYLNFFENSEPTNHNLSHVFIGKDPEGELKSSTAAQPFWVKQGALESLDLLAGTKEILDIIYETPRFFKEFEFHF